MTGPAPETASNLATVAEMKSVLVGIFDKHGKAILNDRQRLLGLLRDKAPTQTRGIRVLMSVYDENVPQNFAAAEMPLSPLAQSQAAEAVIANTGLQAEMANWAVDVWASALAAPATVMAQPVATAAAPTVADAIVPEAPTSAAAPPPITPAEASPIPVAPSVPPAPPAPSDNDLVWDASVPAAAAAAPPAPSAAGYAIAPSYAPTQSPPPQAAPTVTMPPPPTEANKGFLGKWKLSHVITGVVCLAIIGVVREYLDTKSVAPPPVATPAPAPTAAPTAAPQPAAPQILVLSTDSDAKKWPIFDAGVPVKDVARSFQFTFNLRHPNGHLYTYRPSVAFPANPRQGKGVMIAVDQATNTDDMLSETAITTVSRDPVNNGKVLSVNFNTTSWTKNPSNVPSICLSFTSGTQPSKFEPDHAFFCVSELKNNSCSTELGCGRLQ